MGLCKPDFGHCLMELENSASSAGVRVSQAERNGVPCSGSIMSTMLEVFFHWPLMRLRTSPLFVGERVLGSRVAHGSGLEEKRRRKRVVSI